MKKIPRGWMDYLPYGDKVEGTSFFPFKVPLKKEMQHNIPREQRFTPGCLIANVPNLRAVIDLTDTDAKADRYYCPKDFIDSNIDHLKVRISGGGLVPGMDKIKEFSNAVEGFLRKYSNDPDALIGVHCTHGLNRTGYFICMYMVTSLRCDPAVAIDRFQRARGYEMYRQNFIEEIMTPGKHSSSKQTPCYGRENKAKSIRPIGNYTYNNDWLEDIARPSVENNRGTDSFENRRGGRKERHRVKAARMRRELQEFPEGEGVGAEATCSSISYPAEQGWRGGLPVSFEGDRWRGSQTLSKGGFPDYRKNNYPHYERDRKISVPIPKDLPHRPGPFQNEVYRREKGFPSEVERFPRGNDIGVERTPHFGESMSRSGPIREDVPLRSESFQGEAYLRKEGIPFEEERFPKRNDMVVDRIVNFEEGIRRSVPIRENISPRAEPFQDEAYRREKGSLFEVKGFPKRNDTRVDRIPHVEENMRRLVSIRGNLPVQDEAYRKKEGIPFEVERFPKRNDMGVDRIPHFEEGMRRSGPIPENLPLRVEPFQDEAYRMKERFSQGNNMGVTRFSLEIEPRLGSWSSRPEYSPLERNSGLSFQSDREHDVLLPHPVNNPDGGDWTEMRSNRGRRRDGRREDGRRGDERREDERRRDKRRGDGRRGGKFRNPDRRMEYRSPLDDEGSAVAFDRPRSGGYGRRGRGRTYK